MGAVEERIIEQAVQAGDDLPERIKNAPQLWMGLSLYYNAFQELSSCRNHGMGIGPIPWQAINDYCMTYEIEDEQREDMFHYIAVLDTNYRAHVEAKSKTEKPPIGGKAKKRGRK